MKKVLMLLLCFSLAPLNASAGTLLDRLTQSWTKIIGHTKDFEIRKIYAGNTFELNTVEHLRQQSVLVEVWDYKLNRQILLFSPQGSDQFYEIKNLTYAHSNDKSPLQHTFGTLYVDKAGQIEEIPVGMFRDSESSKLKVGPISIKLDRLTPTIEEGITKSLKSEIKRDSWNGLQIVQAYEFEGQMYFETHSQTLETKLLKISDATGLLVDSNMSVRHTRFFTNQFFLNGVLKNNSKDAIILSPEATAKALEFKTFDFKTLVENKLGERKFSPEYYLRTKSGRDLFISQIRLQNVTAAGIESAMFNDTTVNAEVMVEAFLTDSAIEVNFKAKYEYLISGIFLTLYSGPTNKVLKIDITDSFVPKIVQNEWGVQFFGRPFDKNFKKVESDYLGISLLKGAKFKMCRKLFE